VCFGWVVLVLVRRGKVGQRYSSSLVSDDWMYSSATGRNVISCLLRVVRFKFVALVPVRRGAVGPSFSSSLISGSSL
jgi:hypothetical protein